MYTYVSDMNNAHSTIDHFVISSDLVKKVNKHCTIVDIDLNFVEQSVPKPKWFLVDHVFHSYRMKLDYYLQQISYPKNVLQCTDLNYSMHKNSIQYLHDSIIKSLCNAAKDTLVFTKPNMSRHKTVIGGMIMSFLSD